ncbi:MAG: Spy/CpxP family protein refolding chaperone [Vampirovibrionales bacterium]
MKTRITSLILGLLVLSSFGLIGLASAKNCSKNNTKNCASATCVKPQPSAYGHGVAGFGMDKVAEDWKASLGLTAEQSKAFQELETQYKNEVTPLEEKSKASKVAMFEYMGCPSFSQEKVNALIDEYTAQKNTVLKARMDYYFHAQQLLTAEQLKKSRVFWAGHIQLWSKTPSVKTSAQ